MSLIGKILSATIAEMTNHSDYLLQKAIAAGSLISLPLSLLASLWSGFTAGDSASVSVEASAMTLPECAAIISMVLGFCGIVQIIVNVYYKIKNGGKS
ncbi:hypothetical protein KLER11_gp32 [Pararheinheimera phage vB_PsoM_KLER1-1]|nr:hypothetical protein KLER11_gp32 [Pararheinheimera phage vB_PsoM_KLER1-1]